MIIEITDDGSATLRSPHHGDTYHSTRGAVGEARHVFIEAGFNAVNGEKILEIGFGTGLNAWLTLQEAEKSGRRVDYTAIELYPVSEDVAAKLGYTDDDRFMTLHRAPWEEWVEVDKNFSLRKIHADLVKIQNLDTFDVVYFDAFAPDTQPEMWTQDVFARIFAAMAPGGVLVTYCSKGDVRRAMAAVGFAVERLPGALGKRHMLRGAKLPKTVME